MPRLIVLLGNSACRALLEEKIEIAKEHGMLLEKNSMHFFISCHPAYAVRFPQGKRNFTHDFATLKKLLQEYNIR